MKSWHIQTQFFNKRKVFLKTRRHLEPSLAFSQHKVNISSKTAIQSFHKCSPVLLSSINGKEMHNANALFSHNWRTLEYSIVNDISFVFIQSNKCAHAKNKVVAIVTYAFCKASPTSIALWLSHYPKKVISLYGHWLLLWYNNMHFSQMGYFIPF